MNKLNKEEKGMDLSLGDKGMQPASSLLNLKDVITNTSHTEVNHNGP